MKKNISFLVILCLSTSVVLGQISGTILPNQTTLQTSGNNTVLNITNTNASNSNRILDVNTNGNYTGIGITHSGNSGVAIFGSKSGLSGQAGYFEISNNSNTSNALNGISSGSGYAIYGSGNTNAGGYFTSTSGNALLTGTGKVGIGTSTVATNERMQINGRLRLQRDAFSSGLWFNNSANGTALTDGAFIGLNNETAGSETVGFWLNGNFRFTVDRTGNTNIGGTMTSTALAGTGVRSVKADANGTLTTAAQTYTISVSPTAFQPENNNSGTFTALSSSGLSFLSANSTDYVVAPISLPNGAIITGIQFYYYNSDNTKYFSIQLINNSFSTANAGTPIYGGTVSSAGTSLAAFDVPANVNNYVVDNTTSSYHILIYSSNVNGSPLTWSLGMGIKGVKITYTL